MEKTVVVTKRFQRNIYRVYQYVLKEFSPRTAFNFLSHLKRRVEFIASNPEAGKLSLKRKNLRSVLFLPITVFFTPILMIL